MSPDRPTPPPPVRVWDLPIRLFHAGLGLGVGVAWATGPSPTALDLHVSAGTAVGLLLLFRIGWARAGTRWARGRELLPAPARVAEHLRGLRAGKPPVYPGHTPLAAWAAVAGLGLAGLGTLSGLVVLGGEEQVGVLRRIPVVVGMAVHPVHTWAAWALGAWVAIHLIGVVKESLLTGINLPRAMVDGHKPVGALPVPRRGGVALVLAAALGLLLVTPPQAASRAPAAPSDPSWSAECGSCHLAYDPGLLPARSWRRLLEGQAAHFGEDLFLDPETVRTLADWAADHAAEQGRTEAAVRSAQVDPGETPERITALGWWRETHAAVDGADRARAADGGRCGACHPDADAGRFDPLRVHPLEGG